MNVKTSDYASLAAALTAIGSDQATLLIDDEQTLLSNTTIPSNVAIKFVKGCFIVKDSTYTLTINGIIEAFPSQIFSGFSAGDVVINTGAAKEIYAEWWGAAGDLSTDDSTAIQCAIDASSFITPAVLLAKGYKCNSKIVVNQSCQCLRGQGISTVIYGNHSDYALSIGYIGAYNASYLKWGMAVSNLVAWSYAGSGIEFNCAINSKFSDLWAFSTGHGFTIHRHVQGCDFDRLIFSSNLQASIRAMYASLPSITSSLSGIYMYYDTVECNGNVMRSPIVEGAGSHGIQVIGTHTRTSIVDALSEGNTGYGIAVNGNTGYNSFLRIENIYLEANTGGAIYCAKQLFAHLSGRAGSGAATSQLVTLVDTKLSGIERMTAGGISFDADSVGNNIKNVSVAASGGSGFYGAGAENNSYENCYDNNGNLVGDGGSGGTLVDYSDDSTIVGWSSFTCKKIFYKISNNTMKLYFDIEGTSNGTSCTFTLPGSFNDDILYEGFTSLTINDGSLLTTPGRVDMDVVNNRVTVWKDMAVGTWTASGTKRVCGQMLIELA